MIKCIAIDDEPLALRQICSYIGRTPELELAATFTDAISAQGFLAGKNVDLIFADINMPDLNGLDFVRSLEQRAFVIFTTAYSEHAVEGFRLDATDYLLKPFSFDEFSRAVAKVRSLYELLQLARHRAGASKKEAPAKATALTATSATSPATPPATASSPAEPKAEAEAVPENSEYISVKADYKTSLVRIADIIYIESEGEYVRLHLCDGSTLMTLFRLKNMEAALPADSFMQVHRSFVVNLKFITGYARGRIYLTDGEYIPIGDKYRTAFQQYIERNFQSIG